MRRTATLLALVTLGATGFFAIQPGLGVPIAPLGASLAASASCQPTWPMYQHDAAHSGAQACSTIDSGSVAHLAPAWFVPTAQPVTATPSIVGGTVFVGDAGGTFYALDQTTGAVRWTLSVTNAANACHAADEHATSYGEITSSANVADVGGALGPTVFFGGGATLYALDAATGACRWSQNLDPSHPTGPMEILSSPVIDLATSPPEVIVGDDTNESPGASVGEAGVQAFDARDGTLMWRYEPERNAVVHSLATSVYGPDGQNDGCGDVWTSPALDTKFRTGGLVVFGTGNCPDATTARINGDFSTSDGVFAIDAVTGNRVWSFFEPPNSYANTSPNEPDGGDDDFGSSPVLARVAAPIPGDNGFTNGPGVNPPGKSAGGKGGTRSLVLEGSKSGYMYALDETTGNEVWGMQVAQPGQTGSAAAGAIGGFLGAAAMGKSGGTPALFATSAIPAPLAGAGVNGTSATPDTSLAADPLRASSLHAIEAATGAVLWQQPLSTPSYAATTYVNGVVFAPGTTSFSVEAYDALNGVPLWAFPIGAALSSGVAVIGSSVVFGAGTATAGPQEVPPQANGVWSFALTPQVP